MLNYSVCIIRMGSEKYEKKRKNRLYPSMLCIVFSAFLMLCFLKKTHDTEESYDAHNLNTLHKDNPRASIARKQLRKQDQHFHNSFSKIDIGIVGNCVKNKFKGFVKRHDRRFKNGDKYRFLIMNYGCPYEFPSTIGNIELVSHRTRLNFSRASNINELSSFADKNRIFAVVDIDMQIDDVFLEHARDYVMPYKAYFPIVWSTYSQTSISTIRNILKTKILKFSNYAGTWREWGYGMFAIHMSDFVRFKLDERFKGWGGEDNDFFKRVSEDKRMHIVRERERGLVHYWHPKVCKNVEKHEMKACLGSKATYTSSNLGWMLMHEKRVHHDKILIAIPTCLKYIQRIETILETWAKDIPNHIELLFFIAKSEIVEAQKMLPDVEFIAGNISASEYPPVRRNIKMLEKLYAEKNFDWVLKVDDDSYVNIGNLQTLTYSFRTSSHAFLGSRGYGRLLDRDFLDLKKPFCMGGPGYLLRKSTLARVIPEFPTCLRDAENDIHKYNVWHSDVVISKCVTKVTKLGCWESDDESLIQYSNNLFKQHYTSAKPVYNTVTYHPLKTRDAMVQYHNSIINNIHK